jgi:integration host factor subunit alpha
MSSLDTGISEEQAARLIEWILILFKSTLQRGEPIVITNFGSFRVRSKRPRRGRKPRTGEEVMISSRRVVTFRASPDLKASVNVAYDTPKAVTRTAAEEELRLGSP